MNRKLKVALCVPFDLLLAIPAVIIFYTFIGVTALRRKYRVK